MQPTTVSATTCTTMPNRSKVRRPNRSTKAIATNVNSRFTVPTIAVDIKASFVATPEVAKILVE